MARFTTPTASIRFALEAHRKETGSIVHFPGGEDMDRDEALFLSATSCCRPRART